jgi:hypothetical protein
MIYALIAIGALIVLVLIIAATRPSKFGVTRSASISAPAQVVFPHVNDLHKWQEWSPWAKMDPTAKVAYEGPDAGQGAAFSWAGNNKVGEGRMEIVESRPNQLVLFKLDFLKPMRATNTAEFTFKPDGDQTIVTWTMSGKNNLMGKIFSMFVNCDKMIGGQFEQGLANMKALAEGQAKA